MNSFTLRERIQEKLIGLVVFAAYYWLLSHLWNWDSYPSTPSLGALAVVVCAFWNSVSHWAVVLQALNSGRVWYIVIGAVFDLFSCILYLVVLSSRDTHPLLWILSFYDLGVHYSKLVALMDPNPDLRRVQDMVASAVNNLQGKPGRYWKDHLFAYMDTSQHCFYLVVGVTIVGWELTATAIGSSLFWAGMSYLAWSVIFPTESTTKRTTPRASLHRLSTTPSSGKAPKAFCSCRSCEKKATCFSIYPDFCELWHCTFEELLDKLGQANRGSIALH